MGGLRRILTQRHLCQIGLNLNLLVHTNRKIIMSLYNGDYAVNFH